METTALASKRQLLQDLWLLNRRLDGVALALENSGQALAICAEMLSARSTTRWSPCSWRLSSAMLHYSQFRPEGAQESFNHSEEVSLTCRRRPTHAGTFSRRTH